MSVNVAPSILSADKSKIEEEISLAISSGAKYLHIDIMDGKFVPSVTFDESYVKIVCSVSTIINDVHLMVVRPEEKVASFAASGADILTFHYEAMDSDEEILALIRKIHALGKKAGISIKPNTKAEVLFPFWNEIDLALVMSVEPGKGGQAFIPSALGKIEAYAKKNKEISRHVLIEVDGGINAETGKQCAEKGADILVAGSYLFGHEDFAKRVRGLLKS